MLKNMLFKSGTPVNISLKLDVHFNKINFVNVFEHLHLDLTGSSWPRTPFSFSKLDSHSEISLTCVARKFLHTCI